MITELQLICGKLVKETDNAWCVEDFKVYAQSFDTVILISKQAWFPKSVCYPHPSKDDMIILMVPDWLIQKLI
jgi:hypothetical protein